MMGAGVPEMMGAGVPEMMGAGVPEMMGAGVPEMMGAGVPEMMGAGVPEMMGAGVPEMMGAASSLLLLSFLTISPSPTHRLSSSPSHLQFSRACHNRQQSPGAHGVQRRDYQQPPRLIPACSRPFPYSHPSFQLSLSPVAFSPVASARSAMARTECSDVIPSSRLASYLPAPAMASAAIGTVALRGFVITPITAWSGGDSEEGRKKGERGLNQWKGRGERRVREVALRGFLWAVFCNRLALSHALTSGLCLAMDSHSPLTIPAFMQKRSSSPMDDRYGTPASTSTTCDPRSASGSSYGPR
ncbi:unnamed protein product [Closterium sp. Naga37s-1]|nr:unnamed protein product [Closterium sp. Naga37s-1]